MALRDYVSLGLAFVVAPQSEMNPELDNESERALLLDLGVTMANVSPKRLASFGRGVERSELSTALDVIRGRTTVPYNDHPDHAKVFELLCDRLRNTRISISPRKHIWAIPEKTQVDDVICILAVAICHLFSARQEGSLRKIRIRSLAELTCRELWMEKRSGSCLGMKMTATRKRKSPDFTIFGWSSTFPAEFSSQKMLQLLEHSSNHSV